MPTISIFFGIVVYMYLADDKQHHLPHIHTRYQVEESINCNWNWGVAGWRNTTSKAEAGTSMD
jgi:hypothetical protein